MADQPVIRISRDSIDRRKAAEHRVRRGQWNEAVGGVFFPGVVLAVIALAGIGGFASSKPGPNLLLAAGATAVAVFLTIHVARSQAAGRVGVLSQPLMTGLPGLAGVLAGLIITAGAFLIAGLDPTRCVAIWLPPLPVAVILAGAMWGNPQAVNRPTPPPAAPRARPAPLPTARPIPGWNSRRRPPRAIPVSRPTPPPPEKAGRVKVTTSRQCRGCLSPLTADQARRVCPEGHEVHAECVECGLVKACPECKRAFY